MASAPAPRSRLLKRLLLGTAVVAVTVPVAGYIALSQLDTAALSRYAQTLVHDHTGRTLTIGQDAQIAFGLSPSVTLGKVALSNPDWAKRSALFSAESVRVELALLPLLYREVVIRDITAVSTTLALEKNASGKGSWEFTPSKPAKEKKNAAVAPTPEKQGKAFTTRLGPIHLSDTTVTYEDHVRGKPLTLALPSLSLTTEPTVTLDAQLAVESLQGTLRVEADTADALMQNPIRLALDLRGEKDANLTLKGRIKNLGEKPTLDFTLDATTDSLAAFSALSGAALPETEPLAIQASITGNGQDIVMENVKARLGETEAAGRGRLLLSGEKPMISASLAIPSYAPKERADAPAAAAAESNASPAISEAKRIIPDVAFPSDGLSAVNADIEFTIGEIKTKKTTLNSAMGHLVLKGGILQIDPMQFKLGEDLIKGRVAYNSRAKTPVIDMSFNTQGKDLGAFLKGLGTTEKVHGGSFHGEIALKGQGRSLHAMLPTVSGMVQLVTEQATLKDPKLQEATAFASLLQGKERSGDVLLNCALSKVQIANGIATPDYLVVDTKHLRIYGEGTFTLPTEQLALTFYPQPKSAGFAELSFPVVINGGFANPTIKPDRTQAAFSVSKMFVDSKKLRGLETLLGKGKAPEKAQHDLSGLHPCLTPIAAPESTTPSLKDAVDIKKEGVKENLKDIEDDVRGLRDGLKGLLR